MRNAVYAAVQDFVDEGTEQVLDRLVGLGVDGVVLATSYHRARDVTPHSPTRLTVRHDGAYFDPDSFPDLFGAGSLAPPRVAPELAVASDVVGAAAARGLGVGGWTVLCHSTTLGLAHPEVTQLSCFGGREAPADLCPANPRVRRYVRDLVVATARLGVDTVLAEALHYGSFGHGYHHERSFVALGEVEQWLFGLCFCEHCAAAVRRVGGDPDRARQTARREIDRVLGGGVSSAVPLTTEAVAALGDDLAAMLRARTEIVTSLVAEAAVAAADAGSRLTFVDPCGAALGYADGLPTGPLAADVGWRVGIDAAALGRVADYAVLTYASDTDRIAKDVARYRALLGPRPELRAVLRPGLPDTRDAAHLAAKSAAARTAGADAVDFYHYGLATLADLDRIAATTSPSTTAPHREERRS